MLRATLLNPSGLAEVRDLVCMLAVLQMQGPLVHAISMQLVPALTDECWGYVVLASPHSALVSTAWQV